MSESDRRNGRAGSEAGEGTTVRAAGPVATADRPVQGRKTARGDSTCVQVVSRQANLVGLHPASLAAEHSAGGTFAASRTEGILQDNICHGLGFNQSVTNIILQNALRSGCGKGAARRVFRG